MQIKSVDSFIEIEMISCKWPPKLNHLTILLNKKSQVFENVQFFILNI